MDKNKPDKNTYDNAYIKANYIRYGFKYRTSEIDPDLLKQIANFKGESVNEFIKKAVIARIESIEQGLE